MINTILHNTIQIKAYSAVIRHIYRRFIRKDMVNLFEAAEKCIGSASLAIFQ